jgi:hypothetical protein
MAGLVALFRGGSKARARAALLCARVARGERAPHFWGRRSQTGGRDLGGHGYTTVRVDGDEMETEFVCIPRPVERIDAPDGGPLAYRVVHRVRKWARGEHPDRRQEVVEGHPPLAIQRLALDRATGRARG